MRAIANDKVFSGRVPDDFNRVLGSVMTVVKVSIVKHLAWSTRAPCSGRHSLWILSWNETVQDLDAGRLATFHFPHANFAVR